MTIYNGFDPEKRYAQVLVHSDRVAQSREPNEIQSIISHRITRIANVLFKDGDITGGARCTVNPETGDCALEAGSIFIAGAVHDLPAKAMKVPVAGTVYVGVVYRERVVTAVEDPSLYNPADGTQGHGEPGADRLQILTSWGLQGDGQQGNFYPVWTIEDGIVRPREPAPNLNAVTQAIERYARDSSGGTWVVRGMVTVQQPDDAQARQVFTITAGAARVGGVAIEIPTDRRLVFDPKPDIEQVDSEPHNVDTTGKVVAQFDRWPVLQPASVRIQRARTVKLTHGAFMGVADPLPDNAVVKINSVSQGSTVYAEGPDFKLVASQIDWSPSGAEPTVGSTYDVVYEYISKEPVLNQTARTFEVQGGVAKSVMYVDYAYAMRRIDRIIMGVDGALGVIRGIPATWAPVAPAVPESVLALASIYQTWDVASRRAEANAVRMVPTDVLNGYQRQFNELRQDMAELRLSTDVSGRYGGLRKGYFADPMINNSMRDQGREQTAVVANGALQLFEVSEAHRLGDGASSVSMPYTLVSALVQSSASRAMFVSGDKPPVKEPDPDPGPGQPEPPKEPPKILPSTIRLVPAIDRWEEPKVLAYPREVSVGLRPGQSVVERQQEQFDKTVDPSLIDKSDVFMRTIEVEFSIAGFFASEALESMSFDGVSVQALGVLVADAKGEIRGKFKIPERINVGVKTVSFKGTKGSYGSAQFIGSATLKVEVRGRFTNIYGDYGYTRNVLTYVI